MRIDEALSDSPAGRAMMEAARRQGADPEQVRAAMAVVIPELSRHIERNTLSRGGLADLVAALGAPQHSNRLTNPDLLGDTTVANDGNAILGHIVGGKDASRAIAARAAQASGLSESLIKMLLPFIASMLMSALQRYLQGGLGDILKRLPGGGSGSGNSPSPPLPRGGRPSNDDGGFSGRGFELPQQGPIEGLPDRGGTSGRMEDLPRQMPAPAPPRDPPGRSDPYSQPSPGSFPQQIPPSMPGEGGFGGAGRSPFDDITDILRRGSGPNVGDQTVRRSVRDLIGGALGFSKGGVMSWIIRLIVVRFGWGILKRILGRVAGGR